MFACTRTAVSQLYSIEPSGGGLAQLTFGAGGWASPVPSPNGRFVAAVQTDELWLMHGDGRGARLLARAGASSPSWSRDSRRLAFAKDGEIWTTALAGGAPRPVTHGPDDSAPTLSPDGRSLAFRRQGTVLVVRRHGRERVVLHDVFSGPVWSPDGKWIAVTTGRDPTLGTVELVRPSGGAPKVVLAACPYCFLSADAWSPDSRGLAYVNGRGIYAMVRDGGGWQQRPLGPPYTNGFGWSPRGKAIAFATDSGVEIVTLAGELRTLVPYRPRAAGFGVGWSWAPTDLAYQKPEKLPYLVHVSPRELEARVPIQRLSADGNRVAFFLCPFIFGGWRPGDKQPLLPDSVTLFDCLQQENVNYLRDFALAGDRLAYLVGTDGAWKTLVLTTLEQDHPSVRIAESDEHPGQRPALGDVVGARTTIVYGSRQSLDIDSQGPETIWRVDDAKPVQITYAPDDLQPLAVDQGRIAARRPDGSLELLDLDGGVLRTFDVSALGAALAGDDLVVLVHGELRDYSASTGELRYVWPLPDVPSVELDDAARGIAVYTLDGVVHLLRLSSGADVTVPGATAAELTGAGLFYAYPGEEPWPGRIRFIPFEELPLH